MQVGVWLVLPESMHSSILQRIQVFTLHRERRHRHGRTTGVERQALCRPWPPPTSRHTALSPKGRSCKDMRPHGPGKCLVGPMASRGLPMHVLGSSFCIGWGLRKRHVLNLGWGRDPSLKSVDGELAKSRHLNNIRRIAYSSSYCRTFCLRVRCHVELQKDCDCSQKVTDFFGCPFIVSIRPQSHGHWDP